MCQSKAQITFSDLLSPNTYMQAESEVARLRQENVVLRQHNEVLHTCWVEAQGRANATSKRCLSLADDLAKQNEVINELQSKLNAICSERKSEVGEAGK